MKPTLHVAAACDQSYAMPLAVTLASLSANLRPSRSVRVHVMQRQLPIELRQKIERSTRPGAVEINWIDIGTNHLQSLRATLRSFDTVSLESYYRLLLPDVLPQDLDKVIYLDSDLVVISDLSRLWDMDVTATSLFAASELAPSSRLVSSSAGIRLYRELGLSPDLKFFNSGVMLINLRKWRQDRVALRAFVYLEAAMQYLRWHDQEALNAVLAGDWNELDPRWNVTMHLFRADSKSAQSRRLLREPYIVHFNSAIKPWQRDFSLGFRELFFQYLDKTAWSGWRPDNPGSPQERLKKTLRRAAQKRYHIVSSRARNLASRAANWGAVRGHMPKIDINAIPSRTHHEVRAFVNVIEPCPILAPLLAYYNELGADRLFLVVNQERATEAGNLSRERKKLHVFVKEKEDSHSVHLRLRNLLDRYGRRNWCVLINSDELFYYPHAEKMSFKHLCQYLDTSGFDAIPGQIVDLQSSPRFDLPLQATKQSPAMPFLQLDDSHKRLWFHYNCCAIRTVARDPVTERIFPASILLADQQQSSDSQLLFRSKIALLKYNKRMKIADDFRAVYGVRLGDVQGALLRMTGGFSKPQPWAGCRGLSQLLDLGIAQSSPAFDALYRSFNSDQD